MTEATHNRNSSNKDRKSGGSGVARKALRPEQKKPAETLPAEERGGKALVVLEAARKVFFQHGFTAATTDMIQQAAGVSKSTLYAHFGSKEGMFAAVIRAECARHLAKSGLEDIAGGNIRERLTAFGKAYLKILLGPETIALYRLVIEVAPIFPELAETFYESGPDSLQAAMRRHLEQALKNDELAAGRGDARFMSALLLSTLRGEFHLFRAIHPGRAVPPADVEQWIDAVVDIFLSTYGTEQHR